MKSIINLINALNNDSEWIDFKTVVLLSLILILFLSITSCTLFPTSEYIYNFIKNGKHFTGDDFEANDGRVSIRYPWQVEGYSSVTQDHVYNGSWSAKFGKEPYDTSNQKGCISLDANFETDSNISFWLTGYFTYCSVWFYIDSKSIELRKNVVFNTWEQFTVTIPSGLHSIKWSNTSPDGYTSFFIYIDDIIID